MSEPKWARPKPTPALDRIIRTHVEVDLSELNVTPAAIEPSAYIRALALDNASLFQAYMSAGFARSEAFDLLQQQLDAVLHRGHR
jgi:hypothetical protein